MRKMPVRFKAELPLMLKDQVVYKRISKKVYDTLPEEERDMTAAWNFYKAEYRRIVRLEPFPNPWLKRLKAKLIKQRVKFNESLETNKKGV